MFVGLKLVCDIIYNMANINIKFPHGIPFISGAVEGMKLIDFDKLYSDIQYPQRILQCKFMKDYFNEDDVKVIDMFHPRVDLASVSKDYNWVLCSIQKM